MRWRDITPTNPRIKVAIEELKVLIRSKYPEAEFAVYRGEDPVGIFLEATIDVDDTDEAIDLVRDKVLEYQIDRRMPVYVLPLPPLSRSMPKWPPDESVESAVEAGSPAEPPSEDQRTDRAPVNASAASNGSRTRTCQNRVHAFPD